MIPFQDPQQTTQLPHYPDISQQQTIPHTAATPISEQFGTGTLADAGTVAELAIRKTTFFQRKNIIITSVFIAIISSYFVWQATHQTPTTDQVQILTTVTPVVSPINKNDTSASSGGMIQVYITGAVQRPGVYTLSKESRIYQLLQLAGGPQNNANLVALNLAAHLNDGQEIYVPHVGETIPGNVGTTNVSPTTNGNGQAQLVNINTASADEIHQQLHLSSKTAQAIVDYRTQHGSFTSVEVLLQVVSKNIYAKIKDMVTVS